MDPNQSNDATMDINISLLDSILLGDIEKVTELIQQGADVNFPTTMGSTGLHYAASMNSCHLVMLLLSHGAKSIKDKSGQLPEDMTREPEVIKLLQGKKTSLSHPFEIDFIDKNLCPELKEARIGMSMCPGRVWREWSRELDVDLEVILNRNVNVVASIITNTELKQMNRSDFYDRVRNSHLESLELSVHDKWLPNSVDNFNRVVNTILDHLQQDKTVLVHCNGGRGRTGLVVAACIYNLGYTIDQAINMVRTARTGMLRNPAQELFLRSVISKSKSSLFDKSSPRKSRLLLPIGESNTPLTPRSLSQPASPRSMTGSSPRLITSSPRTPRFIISQSSHKKSSAMRDPNAEIYCEINPPRMTSVLENAGASMEIPIDVTFSPILTIHSINSEGALPSIAHIAQKEEDSTINCT